MRPIIAPGTSGTCTSASRHSLGPAALLTLDVTRSNSPCRQVRLRRNELITKLSDNDNDTVVVSIGGIPVDVDSVSYDRGSVILILDPQDTLSTLVQIAATRPIPDRPTTQH